MGGTSVCFKIRTVLSRGIQKLSKRWKKYVSGERSYFVSNILKIFRTIKSFILEKFLFQLNSPGSCEQRCKKTDKSKSLQCKNNFQCVAFGSFLSIVCCIGCTPRKLQLVD